MLNMRSSPIQSKLKYLISKGPNLSKLKEFSLARNSNAVVKTTNVLKVIAIV